VGNQSHERAAGKGSKSRISPRMVAIAAGVIALLLIAAAWRWTPLKEWLDADTLVAFSGYVKDGAYTPLWVAGAYLLAGMVMFPVTVLNLAVVIVFGAIAGPLYALCGASLSAACSYWIGRRLGRERVRRFAGKRITRLNKSLAREGVLAMSLVRLVPIAPFTVVNIVAGASQIGFGDYLLGTAIGMAPGICATTLVVNRATAVFREPGALTIGLLAALVVILVTAVVLIRRRFAAP
jgi:phospholipase D1/2